MFSYFYPLYPARLIYREVKREVKTETRSEKTSSCTVEGLNECLETINTLDAKLALLSELLAKEFERKNESGISKGFAMMKKLLSEQLNKGDQATTEKVITTIENSYLIPKRRAIAIQGTFVENPRLTAMAAIDYRTEMKPLDRYTREAVLAEVQFERLPQEEKELIQAAQIANFAAVSLYDKTPGWTNDDSTQIREQNYTTVFQEKEDWTEEGKNIDPNTMSPYVFYSLFIKRYVGNSTPNEARIRLRNRQLVIAFLQTDGANIPKTLRAQIYIDLANSFLLYSHPPHQAKTTIKEYNPVLAQKFLDQAISMLEPINSPPTALHSAISSFPEPSDREKWKIDQINLAYAHYRRAKLQSENTKERKTTTPNPSIIAEFEKSLSLWPLTSTFFDYTNYLWRFRGQTQKVAAICDRAEKNLQDHKYLYADKTPPTLSTRRIAEIRIACLQRLLLYDYNIEGVDPLFQKLEKFKPEYDYEFQILKSNYERNKRIHRLREEFLSKTPAKRREIIASHFSDTPPGTRAELLYRYEHSAVIAVQQEFKNLITKKSLRCKKEIEALLPIIARNSADWKLLEAHLFDDYAPNEVQHRPNRKRAFDYYKEALTMKDNSGKSLLGEFHVFTAIARCYRFLNSPDQYSASDYSISGGLSIGTELVLDHEKNHFTIKDPSDLVILYQDANGRGIAINRYLNLPESLGWEYLKGQLSNTNGLPDLIKKRRELLKRRRILSSQLREIADKITKNKHPDEQVDNFYRLYEEDENWEQIFTPENFSLASKKFGVNLRQLLEEYYQTIPFQLSQIEAILRPEAAGGIYWIQKNPKTGHLQILSRPITSFTQDNEPPDSKTNKINFPIKGFSCDTLHLPGKGYYGATTPLLELAFALTENNPPKWLDVVNDY